MGRIAPQQTGGPAATYFDGCNAGELRLQHCSACDRWQFYPRAFCTACGGASPQWKVASGRGRIASFTVVRRAISAAYDAPYAVALIDLEEGPRMMSTIVGVEMAALRVGAAVQVAFEQWSDAQQLPVFHLEPAGGDA